MTERTYDFNLRTNFDVTLEHIGNEREPVLIVDGVLAQPESLVDYACDEVAFAPAWGPSGGYPGVRAPAPLNYVSRLVRSVDPLLQRAFELTRVKLGRAECNLSMVTMPPDRLRPTQQSPHFDTVNPLQFAFLHYLCGPEHGGTSFYRHRRTGFETLTAEREAHYDAVRAEELKSGEMPAEYIRGDTEHFVQTATFESRFNRMIIYRSRTLHSGQILQPTELRCDPREGRLTANIFVQYLPRRS